MSIEFKDPVVLYMLRTYDTLTEYRGWFTMDLLMYRVRNRIRIATSNINIYTTNINYYL